MQTLDTHTVNSDSVQRRHFVFPGISSVYKIFLNKSLKYNASDVSIWKYFIERPYLVRFLRINSRVMTEVQFL